MKSAAAIAVFTTVICVITIGPAPEVNAQSKRDMTKEDVERLVVDLSNWGRWGEDDELGTLNLITPEKRKEAAQLVTEGISVSLAHNAVTDVLPDNPSPFIHTMLATTVEPGNDWAMDNFNVAYHGYAHTHMDALCHLFYNGKLYNGYSADLVGPQGAAKLGIENVKNGIFTRAILIDIPRLRGLDYLEPGSPIYPEELEGWENRAGVRISAGDVLFIRTGRWLRRQEKGPWDPIKEGMAGLHASCGEWLKRRDIAALGCDGVNDVVPSRITGVRSPIHVLTMHAMGMPLFDNCDLEAVAETAARLNRWDFLLTVAPLPVKGATGSPFNPIATF